MDLTARIREQLLAKHSEDNGLPLEPAPTHREGPHGGYTAHLARQLRDKHDKQHESQDDE